MLKGQHLFSVSSSAGGATKFPQRQIFSVKTWIMSSQTLPHFQLYLCPEHNFLHGIDTKQRNAFLPSFVSYLSSKRQIFSRTVKFSGCVLDANCYVFNDWDTRHKCDRDQEAEDAVTISWRYLEVFVFDDIFHSNLARTRFGHQRSHLCLDPEYVTKRLLRNISFPWKKNVCPHQYIINITAITAIRGGGWFGEGPGYLVSINVSPQSHSFSASNILLELSRRGKPLHHITLYMRQARIIEFDNLLVQV